MDKYLCPSLMCADMGHIQRELCLLENAGADRFHIDVMDGSFVPNFGLGMQSITYICAHSHIPCDIHLMIREPGLFVEQMAKAGAEYICIHPESELHPARTLQRIREMGCKAGLAIEPGAALETVRPLFPLSDYLVLMTVNPGFAGQRYMDFVTEKMASLGELHTKYGYEIMVDGACSPERIQLLSSMGASGFVLGTSALFGKGRDYKEIMDELRRI